MRHQLKNETLNLRKLKSQPWGKVLGEAAPCSIRGTGYLCLTLAVALPTRITRMLPPDRSPGPGLEWSGAVQGPEGDG